MGGGHDGDGLKGIYGCGSGSSGWVMVVVTVSMVGVVGWVSVVVVVVVMTLLGGGVVTINSVCARGS